MSDYFSSLSSDLTVLILSYLPIPSLVSASCVCKLWNSLISSPTFPSHSSHRKHPWFFLHGLHNIFSKNNQSFAFDPSSNSWLTLPTNHDFCAASNGFLFSTSSSSFSFSHALKQSWKSTSPLRFSRINPLLGVFDSSNSVKFIVVGGVRFIGNLVNIEDEGLAVEIYDPSLDSWELCPPLPADFPSGNNSSQTISSSLFKGKFFIMGIYNFFVSSFNLSTRTWSQVQTLRPSGVIFAFLIACEQTLVLAGMCNGPTGPSFHLWRVDENTTEFSEIAIMPQELLYSLVDIEEDDMFASLKCVGTGTLVYVFNEEHHKKYPACVCEIGNCVSGSGNCRWRKVPPLSSPVNKFHRVISYSSIVLPHDVFPGAD